MALFSLHTSSIKRGDGRSAIAAAAYRAGAEIVNETTGLVHDYTRKNGVEHVEIFTRDGVPSPEKSDLWNAAEAAEKRRDGRTAREVLIALPAELDAQQRLALARQMTGDLVERYGVAAQLAVHAPDADGDERNHHAHVLLTTRTYGHDGLGKKSQLEWSGTQCRKNGVAKPADELRALRERWADMQNVALEGASVDARVDHRSLADQGTDRVPQIHVGNFGTGMIRKGTPEKSERASLNLEIIATNAEVQQLREQLAVEEHQLQHRAQMRAAEAENKRLADEAENYQHTFSPLPVQPAAQEPEPPQRDPLDEIHDELALFERDDELALFEAKVARIQREHTVREKHPASALKPAMPPTPAQYQPPTPPPPRRPAPEPEAFTPPTPTQRKPQPAAEPKPVKPAAQEPEAFIPPTPQERAQAAILEVLSVPDRHERASIIREAVLDPDERYAEAFEDAMIDAGVGVHGELSPAAQRRVEQIQQLEKPEPKPQQEPDWPSPGGDSPGF